MAKINLQAIRGMNDILPDESPLWQNLEDTVRQVLESYGYQQIRMPVMEPTELFKRSIGEVTDIVEKEMYTFDDRNGDSLTLRPEGTAGCVRAALQHGLLHNQVQRLWYTGPMFRHERPQKGRYRQFYQIGVEAFGFQGPDIDIEMILITARLWKALGLAQDVSLQINTLGDAETRQRYRDKLVAFLELNIEQLDEDSKRRIVSNPLRVLDSKNPQVQALVQGAPKLMDELGEEELAHFSQLQAQLSAAGIEFEVNPCLVRGLDYYNRTVFEWVTESLGAQGTVCAGGRYDGLVEQLGGKSVPAVGFAMGIERLILLLQQQQWSAPPQADIYLVAVGDATSQAAILLAEQLRDQLPECSIMLHCGGGSFKSQLKKADKSGAKFALIMGEEELAEGIVQIKPLRENMPQQSMPVADLAHWCRQQFA